VTKKKTGDGEAEREMRARERVTQRGKQWNSGSTERGKRHDDESKRARRRESTSANVKYDSMDCTRSERKRTHDWKCRKQGTQAADEARRSVSDGKRLLGGGKEERGGGDVGAEGERDTERIPREIPDELT
jgi:hypothetical protein